MDKVYIFGHRKPDTDSVCASISLSYLKNKTGLDSEPRVLSPLNKESKFVLNYFNVEEPKYLSDVKLQIKDLNYLKDYYNLKTDSIYQGFKNMSKHQISTTLIVDENKKFLGIVGMKDIAKNQLCDDYNKFCAKYDSIKEVVEGEEILRFKENFEGTLLTASYSNNKIISSVKMDEKTILITGDRISVIEHAIGCNVSLIILTGNAEIENSTLELAKKHKTSIIRSKYDTFRVNKVINLANNIETIIRKTSISCMNENDFVDDFVDNANKTKFSYYPVVDNNNKCLGILRLSDLGEKNKKKCILVDHNAYDQSVDGLEQADILEIIDHHNIGTVGTSMPINFRNMPLGSSNTIIYLCYKEQNIEIPKNMAGMMLSGILSDTLILKSPTTTELDKIATEELAKIAGVDYKKYGMEMFNAGTSLDGMTKSEILHTDYKLFPAGNRKMAISQVFTTNIENITNELDEYLDLLESTVSENELLLCTLAVTDIINNGSYIFFNKSAKEILEKAFDIKDMKQGEYIQDVVSRKKQILPNIMRVIE
jgi:manganese-dependent inorganic pyrophosphatase